MADENTQSTPLPTTIAAPDPSNPGGPQVPDSIAAPESQASTPMGQNQPPQMPQPQMPDVQQQQQQQQQPKDQSQSQAHPDMSSAPSGAPSPADHPLVKSAGIIHNIAQTIAGGPRVTYNIDPNTGEMKATQTPLSGRSIAQAIALAALSGGLAGLGERGPGVEGKAAAAGAAAVEQKNQQADQAAQQQASQNFARQAQITQTNFQTHQNALRLGTMEYDAHKEFVNDSAPVLKNLQDAGAVLEQGVHEGDLLTKYHVTKDMAVVDGVVPRMGADGKQATNKDGSLAWDNTYSVIDPQKKIELPEDTAKFLADHHVPGYFTIDKTTGKAVPVNFSGSAPIKAGLVVNGTQLASGIRITETAINKQLSSLKDGQGESANFEVNLKDALAKGDVTGKALSAFAPYSGMPLDQAFDQMRKNKVDPQLIGQVESLIPQDAKQGIKELRESSEAKRKAEDAAKNLVITPKNAEDVIFDKSGLYTPEQKASAQAIRAGADNHEVSQAGRKAATEAAARTQAEINVKLKNGIDVKGKSGKGDEDSVHPELNSLAQDPNNYKTVDGTNQAYLEAMEKVDPGRAAILKAYSEGMDIKSYYAAVKKYGGTIAEQLHIYDPSFNDSRMRAADKTLQDSGAAGKMGKTNASASTALEHLGALYDAYGLKAATGLSGEYDTALNQGATEVSSMYANGNKPGEEEIKHTREALDHPLNAVRGRAAAVKTAREAMDKIQENYMQYDKDLPAGMRRTGSLSLKAANAYRKMTNENVDPRLVNWEHDGPPATGQPDGHVLYYGGQPVATARGGHWYANGQGPLK